MKKKIAAHSTMREQMFRSEASWFGRIEPPNPKWCYFVTKPPVSRHLKSNPRRYRRVICKSNPQRRVGYGKENQMGILQSHLSTVPQSQHGREDTDPRGILRSLWLQPKVCHRQTQRSFSSAK